MRKQNPKLFIKLATKQCYENLNTFFIWFINKNICLLRLFELLRADCITIYNIENYNARFFEEINFLI